MGFYALGCWLILTCGLSPSSMGGTHRMIILYTPPEGRTIVGIKVTRVSGSFREPGSFDRIGFDRFPLVLCYT